jgi:CO/xanthine dehydrogenase Mo-binding subunit
MDEGQRTVAPRAGAERGVGGAMPRVDGVAKVTGRACYLDDVDAPGAWHGATVRSTVAHGVLDGLDIGDLGGAVLVTAADIPGRNVVALIEDDQPALVPVGGRIRHVDEPIALVAAPTRAQAFAAARQVTARVSPLPPVLTIDDALAATVTLHGDDNVFKRFVIRKGHEGDAALEAAFAAAAHVVEGTYHTGAQEQMYIEPQAMLASWTGGRLRLAGSMQCPFYVHKALKALLALGDDQLDVAQTVTGGGFGGKEEYPSIIAGHAALLARAAGHPVKLVYDRDEDIAATTKRHPARVRHRLAIAADGTPLAIDVDVVMDGGAYMTLSPVVLSRGVLHAAGPYRCPIVRIVGRVVATSYPPHGAFRGFGAPQTTFAYERQFDEAARLAGVSPWAYRHRHALRPGDTTATGQELTWSVGSDAVLDAVHRVAEAPLERDGVGAGGSPLRRGRGLAFYFHGAGFTGSGEQRLAGRVAVALVPRPGADGFAIEVRSSSTDIGQGMITTFTQIAAAAFGVGAERVHVVDPSTAKVPDSGPTVASRTCMVVGGLVERATRALRTRVETWAQARGGAGGIEADTAAMLAATGEVVELAQYEPPPGIHFDDATYTGAAYPVFGWAACVVDVAVDLDTGEIAVERCVHAVDVGKAINPVVVRGQIEGGTVQALGWGLIEQVVYRDGKVANASMTNCIVPTFADAPELETILVEVPYPYGPHGAKGVGEIPMDGPAAAVANAVRDALGCRFDSIPIAPEDVLAARPLWRLS